MFEQSPKTGAEQQESKAERESGMSPEQQERAQKMAETRGGLVQRLLTSARNEVESAGRKFAAGTVRRVRDVAFHPVRTIIQDDLNTARFLVGGGARALTLPVTVPIKVFRARSAARASMEKGLTDLADRIESDPNSTERSKVTVGAFRDFAAAHPEEVEEADREHREAA